MPEWISRKDGQIEVERGRLALTGMGTHGETKFSLSIAVHFQLID